jgi:hypothetical protein
VLFEVFFDVALIRGIEGHRGVDRTAPPTPAQEKALALIVSLLATLAPN